jgi:hypothetical protein
MTKEHEAQPAGPAGGQPAGGGQAGDQEAPEHGARPDGEEPVPASHSYNQARDEPIPASHDDDGRAEPGEESPAPGAGRARSDGAG